MKDSILKVKNSTDESIEFYVYGDIVSDTDWKWDDTDVMPKDIRNLLDEHQGKKISLYVNSGGGSVFAGLSIKAMLDRAREKGSYITAHIDGLAASIASVLIWGANEVRMPSNSYLMIHKAWTWGQGNANDFKKLVDDLEKIDEGILNTYEANLREGISIDTIKELMDSETWMTGKEAAQYFNITLTDSIEAVACMGESFKNYKSIPQEIKLEAEQNLPQKEEEQEKPQDTTQKEEIKPSEETVTQSTTDEIENLLFEIDLI